MRSALRRGWRAVGGHGASGTNGRPRRLFQTFQQLLVTGVVPDRFQIRVMLDPTA